MQMELIITGKNLHLASFWKWGFFELRNSLFFVATQHPSITAAPSIVFFYAAVFDWGEALRDKTKKLGSRLILAVLK